MSITPTTTAATIATVPQQASNDLPPAPGASNLPATPGVPAGTVTTGTAQVTIGATMPPMKMMGGGPVQQTPGQVPTQGGGPVQQTPGQAPIQGGGPTDVNEVLKQLVDTLQKLVTALTAQLGQGSNVNAGGPVQQTPGQAPTQGGGPVQQTPGQAPMKAPMKMPPMKEAPSKFGGPVQQAPVQQAPVQVFQGGGPNVSTTGAVPAQPAPPAVEHQH